MWQVLKKIPKYTMQAANCSAEMFHQGRAIAYPRDAEECGSSADL